jgi:hypothetical protein
MMIGCASYETRHDPAAMPACVDPIKPASLAARCDMPAQYPDSREVDVLLKAYLQMRADYRELCGKHNALNGFEGE